MPVRLIVFDLDDTLVHSTLAYSKALKSVGLSRLDPQFVSARATVKARLGVDTSARNRLLYFKALLEAEGRFSPARALDKVDRYEKALEQELSRQWQSLARPSLIAKLSQHAALAIVTNENTRTQLIKLRAIDPDGQMFPHVFTSEEWGREKPNPTMILECLKQFQCRPSEAIFVGDDWEKDIEPAIKIGMQGIWTHEFTQLTSNRQHPQAHRITRLDNLLELLKLAFGLDI